LRKLKRREDDLRERERERERDRERARERESERARESERERERERDPLEELVQSFVAQTEAPRERSV
jgi:hypothetical protein